MLELTYVYDGRSNAAGDAWGQVAVRVPDGKPAATYEQLMDEGAEDYRDPESCGDRSASTRDPDGHEIAVLRPW